MPEKPTARQAGHPYDNFIIVNYYKKELRQTQLGSRDKHQQKRQKRLKRLTLRGHLTLP